MPTSYEYDGVLIKKTLPEGRFLEIDYQDGKVKSLNSPNSQSGKAEIVHSFSYGNGYTDVFNAAGLKTRYIHDKRFQLTAIERYDDQKQISNTYYYDRQGNILEAYSLNGSSVKRTYNAFGQVTKEIIKDGEGVYTLHYSYEKKGRLKEIVLPDQTKIAYIYDALFGREVKRIWKDEVLYTHTFPGWQADTIFMPSTTLHMD